MFVSVSTIIITLLYGKTQVLTGLLGLDCFVILKEKKSHCCIKIFIFVLDHNNALRLTIVVFPKLLTKYLFWNYEILLLLYVAYGLMQL